MTNVICISGQICAGSSSLAKILSKKLSLNYFSMGTYIKNRLISSNTNHIINAYDNSLKLEKKQIAIDRFQRIVAKKGNIVIDGKLSIYILNDISMLNIWLYADQKCRIKRLAKRDNLSFSEANTLLNKREIKEKIIWETIYNIKLVKMNEFSNLSFDTGRYSTDEISDIIISKIRDNYAGKLHNQ